MHRRGGTTDKLQSPMSYFVPHVTFDYLHWVKSRWSKSRFTLPIRDRYSIEQQTVTPIFELHYDWSTLNALCSRTRVRVTSDRYNFCLGVFSLVSTPLSNEFLKNWSLSFDLGLTCLSQSEVVYFLGMDLNYAKWDKVVEDVSKNASETVRGRGRHA